jgi:hypothetical protein
VEPQRKAIRLIVPAQYRPLGYREYSGVHDLSDSPSLLRKHASLDGALAGMSMLFRGRRLRPEEEAMSFDALMKKVHSRQTG